MPVFEDAQMGMSLGLAMNGFVPITCYPRFDFLILAFNQLVNHLDKVRKMSRNEIKPRVIIRTSVGSKNHWMEGHNIHKIIQKYSKRH